MTTELNLRFPDANHSIVSFDGTESAANEFINPLTDKDHRDIAWYVETYGAHSLGDPDDQEAARIAGQLPGLGQGPVRRRVPRPRRPASVQRASRTPKTTRGC